MKKLLLLLLIVVGVAQDQEMSELEKQMLYKTNDKSPFIAGLCATTPTIGHLYVGKWKRGLVSSLPLLPLAGISYFTLWDYDSYRRSYTWNLPDEEQKVYDDNKGILKSRSVISAVISGLFFLTWYPIQFQDAIYLAKQHNADLYKEIYGKDYIITPKKSIIQKWIEKKEAKKKAKSTNSPVQP